MLYARVGSHRVARLMNDTLATQVLTNLAPADADASGVRTPKGDGHITVGDAWFAQAASAGVVQLAPGVTPSAVSRLLRASARRLLLDTGESQASLHYDHLGSAVVSTGPSGELAADQAFYPYGQSRASTGFVDAYGFTDQEEDESTGSFTSVRASSTRWRGGGPAPIRPSRCRR